MTEAINGKLEEGRKNNIITIMAEVGAEMRSMTGLKPSLDQADNSITDLMMNNIAADMKMIAMTTGGKTATNQNRGLTERMSIIMGATDLKKTTILDHMMIFRHIITIFLPDFKEKTVATTIADITTAKEVTMKRSNLLWRKWIETKRGSKLF